MNSVKNGLLLWYNYVLPALFPFMISVNLLKATPFPQMLSRLLSPAAGRLFGVSSWGIFAIISGFLSGYPMGAKIVSELYSEKRITKSEAQYLLSFANNSGPLFIIGTLGTGILKSSSIGVYLLAVHYISALIIGISIPKPKTKITYLCKSDTFSLGRDLKAGIYNAVEAIVLLGGYIVFFSILCTLLHMALSKYCLNQYVKSLIFGILEVTNGCKELTVTNRLSLSIISGITAFGGISVCSQSTAYISSADLSASKFILSKILHGILAFTLCFFLCTFNK